VDENPIQLRLGFSAPRSPIRIKLSLSGLRVLVSSTGEPNNLVGQYFSSIGIQVETNIDDVISFSIQEFRRILTFPDQVEIIVKGDLEPLWNLIKEEPAKNNTVIVTSEDAGGFNLNWHNGFISLNEPLARTAAPAFLALEIPFRADNDTWDELLIASRLPVLLGRARVNLDGFIEISTSKSQRVETSPLRALFRVDANHFGIPLSFASDINKTPGFIWEGRRPIYDSSPSELPKLPFELSEHAIKDLRGLIDRLAERRAEAVVWESGLGRRVYSLAAIAALDAFPLLIVAAPHALWSWQRHLDLLGRRYSFLDDKSDVQLVTYRDFLARPNLSSPSSVIFDDLYLIGSEQIKALNKLDGLVDTYRIACMSEFPTDVRKAIEIMSVLKPAEFKASIQIANRYPVRSDGRAWEHISSYVSRRELKSVESSFRRSTVELIQPSMDQSLLLEKIFDDKNMSQPIEKITEALLLLSAGSITTVSPKISLAITLSKSEISRGSTVAIVTRYERTSKLLQKLLLPLNTVLSKGPLDAAVISNSVTIVQSESELGNLRSFDHVIIIDYPISSAVLENAIGKATDILGPKLVTRIHINCELEDRLALISVRRFESGNTDLTLSSNEVDYLLSRRL
jgi:hypothetical protein